MVYIIICTPFLLLFSTQHLLQLIRVHVDYFSNPQLYEREAGGARHLSGVGSLGFQVCDARVVRLAQQPLSPTGPSASSIFLLRTWMSNRVCWPGHTKRKKHSTIPPEVPNALGSPEA